MSTDTSVTELVINKLTKSQYEGINSPSDTEFYLVTDAKYSYNDLADKPTIPTATSDLTNDSGYITSSALSGYADTNASNFTTTGKSVISGLGMPSNTYTDLTNGGHGSSYTAPANGYFVLTGYHVGGNTTNLLALVNWDIGLGSSTIPPTSSASDAYVSIPAKKGDVVYIYNYAGTISKIRFIYAKGN